MPRLVSTLFTLKSPTMTPKNLVKTLRQAQDRETTKILRAVAKFLIMIFIRNWEPTPKFLQ